MAEIYNFRSAPTYSGATQSETALSAFDQPGPWAWTMWEQTKGGAISSVGLGTELRNNQIPEGNIDALSPQDRADRRIGAGPYQFGRHVGEELGIIEPKRDTTPSLNQDAWMSSAYFREDIPWDASMTEDRAAALASWYDAKKVREHFAEKRPITAFIGGLAGQALDPVNYIPIAGPTVKGASILRVAGASALDAAANTAAFGLATREQRARFGDDVSFQAMVSEIALSAMIGGAFGTVAGALGRRADRVAVDAAKVRLGTLKATQEARIALNEGIGALARGEDVVLSPNAVGPIQRVADRTVAEVPQQAPAQTFDPDTFDWAAPMPELLRPSVPAEANVAIEGKIPQAPRVFLYHGTTAERFEQFDIGRAGTGAGSKNESAIFFAPTPEEAYGFAISGKARDRAPRVEGVLVDTRNFQVVDDLPAPSSYQIAKRLKEAKAAGADGVIFRNMDDRSPEQVVRGDAIPDQIALLDTGRAKIVRSAAPEVARAGAVSRLDASPPRPDPIPEGRAEAEAKIAKPDDAKAMAAQFRVDMETGSYIEEADLRQLEAEGRLTDEDRNDLAVATAAFDNGAAYGEALKAAVACVI